MSNSYVYMVANQRPFSFNEDENNRVMFSCNFDTMILSPVTLFEEDLSTVIINASLSTVLGTDIFIGPASVLPTGDGPYVTIIHTSGQPPTETHNGEVHERRSLQVIVTAADYVTGRTRALAIWRLLDETYNTVLP